jgi:hypothetical protein
MIHKWIAVLYVSFSLIVHSGYAFIRIGSVKNDRFVASSSKTSATQLEANANIPSRRSWITDATRTMLLQIVTTAPVVGYLSENAYAAEEMVAEEQFNPDDPEFKELYDNPEIPAPEERSGLVVLRVAEVSQFQEKILRAIVNGDLKDVAVSPMQFAFGTQILLRNSNLDSNMRLMIDQEIPKQQRTSARKIAANVMNTLQDIAQYAGSIKRDFEPLEMVELADMYKVVRIDLNQLYEFLPEKEREKYYGYFVAVTEYEKKIAQGTYNPDIDGVLKFD